MNTFLVEVSKEEILQNFTLLRSIKVWKCVSHLLLKQQQKKWVILSYLSLISKTQCHASQFSTSKMPEHKIAHRILIPHADASFEIQNYQTDRNKKREHVVSSITGKPLHASSWSMNCFWVELNELNVYYKNVLVICSAKMGNEVSSLPKDIKGEAHIQLHVQ